MNDWLSAVQDKIRRDIAGDPERLAALLADVEAEAWQEVRTILKRAMVEALLEGVAEREPTPPAPLPTREGGDTTPLCEGRNGITPDVAGEESPLSASGTACVPRSGRGWGRGLPTEGIYVYGIVKAEAPVALPAEGGLEGIEIGRHVYRDMVAVVSKVPLAEFGEEALEAHLADMAWLEAQVRRHQAVLDAVLAQTTIVPMKFGTVYLEASGLDEFLAEYYEPIKALLDHLHGRSEWGLKVYCSAEELAAYVLENDAELQQIRAQIDSRPAGTAYMFARKLQQAQERAVQQMSTGIAQTIHDTLRELCVVACVNPVQGTEITGRPEQMVLNCAYLVEDAGLERFQAVVREQAEAHCGCGFVCELSGPWPPYNFVRIESGAAA